MSRGILESKIDRFAAGQIMAIGGLMSIFSCPLLGESSNKIGRNKLLDITFATSAKSMLFPVMFL
ncbi:hypothetical protein ACIQZG_18610 [Lysinibacillus sp. NPDC096418]|uniref:hypothetical protein n=1 Tax=Lysinibacillus sp. NPDC096418 TaxID=3364138 RepID=UPI00381B0954